jgi:hypothetical protein
MVPRRSEPRGRLRSRKETNPHKLPNEKGRPRQAAFPFEFSGYGASNAFAVYATINRYRRSMMSPRTAPAPNQSTADAEKTLRSIMIADRKVLRRRSDNEGDRLTPEGRAAIRAARQRHKLKSAMSPGHNSGRIRYG